MFSPRTDYSLLPERRLPVLHLQPEVQRDVQEVRGDGVHPGQDGGVRVSWRLGGGQEPVLRRHQHQGV